MGNSSTRRKEHVDEPSSTRSSDTISRRQVAEEKKRVHLQAQEKRLLIHVAGSPGSGKSHMMEQIRTIINSGQVTAKRPWLLKDVDDFSTPMFKMQEYNILDNDKARGEYYVQYMSRAIEEFANAHSTHDICLFGLTMYWAWDLDTGFEQGEAFVVVPENTLDRVAYHYFIKIADEQLILQRFIRDVEKTVYEEKKQLLSGEKTLDFSANMIRQYVHVEKKQYVDENDYDWLNYDQILSRLLALLGQDIQITRQQKGNMLGTIVITHQGEIEELDPETLPRMPDKRPRHV